MDIRAILLDFDGTALQRDQVFLSLRNMRALRAAMDRGIEIIPSTGRSEDMFPPQIEREERVRYWVTSNGGRVVNRRTGEVIFESLFTPEESAEICRLFEKKKVYAEIAAAGKIYFEREILDNAADYAVPPHHVWYMETDRPVGVDWPSEYFLDNRVGIEKVNLYGVPEPLRRPIIDGLERTGFVSVYEGAGRDIQFFPKRQNREEALAALFQKIGIGFDRVMALGDSTLDVSALKKAALGVAVGNAPDHVKAAADAVTDDFDRDGVAKAIERYLL